MTTPIILPWLVQSGLEAAARVLLEPGNRSDVDFSRPTDEPALISPHSVSWRVCKNPISLFIGGVAAVIMELAEPRVRTGAWEHTTFRENPIVRLRRAGLAAMAGPGRRVITLAGTSQPIEGVPQHDRANPRDGVEEQCVSARRHISLKR